MLVSLKIRNFFIIEPVKFNLYLIILFEITKSLIEMRSLNLEFEKYH